MIEIVAIILPFFGLIGLGYGAGRLLDIPREGAAALDAFVIYLAMPVLFFQAVANCPFSLLVTWSFFVTTAFSTYCAFAIAFSLGALTNRGRIPEATIQGLIGSEANIGIMGAGLAVTAFGTAAGAPTALIFTFDSVLLAALVPLMMALGGTERADGGAMTRSIVRQILRQPLVVATILGFFAAMIGASPPAPIDGLLTSLSSAAVPCALFALGLSFSRAPVPKVPRDLPVFLAIKLVVHPLIVYLLLGWIGGFDSVWVRTAMLVAALPPAAGVLAAARRYQTSTGRAAEAIFFGTLASGVTISLVVILVVGDLLPVDPFH